MSERLESLHCHVPSLGMAPGGELCRWLGDSVRFGLSTGLMGLGLTYDQIKEAIWEVGALVARECNLDLVPVAVPMSADIWGTATKIDTVGGILAQAYLPCPPRRPASGTLSQEYDTSERWSFVLFKKVVLHETLHSLGLPHSNNIQDIMYPSIGPNTRMMLGPGDIAELRRRYGPPKLKPPEPPPKPPEPKPDPDPDLWLPRPDGWHQLTERSGLFGQKTVGWVPIYREQPRT